MDRKTLSKLALCYWTKCNQIKDSLDMGCNTLQSDKEKKSHCLTQN